MDESIDVREVLSLAVRKLERPLSGPDFRLRSIVADAGTLQITFWWDRNPTVFGVKLAAPLHTSDKAWTRWAPGSVDEWVEYAVRLTLDEELQTGLTRRAHRSCSEGVIWLELEEHQGAPAFRVFDVMLGDLEMSALNAGGINTTGPIDAHKAGRLLVWRYATSGSPSGNPLGAISIESGDLPAVCTFDVAPNLARDAQRALLMNAVYTVHDMGCLTITAPHGPEWLTTWGFVHDSSGMLTLDQSSACLLGGWDQQHQSEHPPGADR